MKSESTYQISVAQISHGMSYSQPFHPPAPSALLHKTSLESKSPGGRSFQPPILQARDHNGGSVHSQHGVSMDSVSGNPRCRFQLSKGGDWRGICSPMNQSWRNWMGSRLISDQVMLNREARSRQLQVGILMQVGQYLAPGRGVGGECQSILL